MGSQIATVPETICSNKSNLGPPLKNEVLLQIFFIVVIITNVIYMRQLSVKTQIKKHFRK